MNWKSFVDRFEPTTCILSVEKKPGGGCGTIRIVDGNEKYIDSIALAGGGVEMDSDRKSEFTPNSEYTFLSSLCTTLCAPAATHSTSSCS